MNRLPRPFRTSLLGLLAALACTIANAAPVVAADGLTEGVVFRDLNLNGIQDAAPAAEPGLADVIVRAFDAAGVEVGSAATRADGTFSLYALGAKSDQVRIQVFPPAGLCSGPHTGGASTTVEFVRVGASKVIVGLAEAADPAAESRGIEIGDRVWRDLDGDGLQTADEPPIPGVTVSLWGPAGRLASAVTDAQGRFFLVSSAESGQQLSLQLDNLIDYAAGPLSALTPTVKGAGTNRAVDSDAEVVNMLPRATFAAPAGGCADHGRDFGFVPFPRA